MKIIILAAGYATRLYPLTLNTPKALLPIGGKPVLEYLLERLRSIEGVDQVYIVTNGKFVSNFEQWLQGYNKQSAFPLKILNDKSVNEISKLGAIGDLNFVLDSEKINDNVIVVAGDAFFTDSLEGFALVGLEKGIPIVGITTIDDPEEVKKHNFIRIDNSDRIIYFEEKSKAPETNIVATPIYFYPKNLLSYIRQYLEEKNNPDQPGRLVEWLYKKIPVYSWRVPGLWLDIGTLESIVSAEKYLKGLKK